jgi:drug/metabolite transporter (DMT)-like permease
MPGIVVALVLGSSLLHASWNVLVKRSIDKAVFSWLASLVATVLTIPFAVAWWHSWDAAPSRALWAGASGIWQSGYVVLLALAYEHSDLSIAYPLSRGWAPVFLMPITIGLMHERVAPLAGVGIAVIVVGSYTLHMRSLRLREWAVPLRAAGERGSLLAIATALTIAVFHAIDKRGVTGADFHLSVVYLWLIQVVITVCVGAHLIPSGRWRNIGREWRQGWLPVTAMAVMGFVAYILILVAFQSGGQASYVVPFRNTSIVIGTLLGALHLREVSGGMRVTAAVAIAAGAAMIALSRG